jgi:hypothetical protein
MVGGICAATSVGSSAAGGIRRGSLVIISAAESSRSSKGSTNVIARGLASQSVNSTRTAKGVNCGRDPTAANATFT